MSICSNQGCQLTSCESQTRYLYQWFPQYGPRLRAIPSPGKLLAIQILRFNPNLQNQKTPEGGLSHLCSMKPSRWFRLVLKFEKHRQTLWDSLSSCVGWVSYDQPCKARVNRERTLALSQWLFIIIIIIIIINQGPKLREIRTSKWCAATTGWD